MFKASGLSATQMHRQYGFEKMKKKSKKVEEVIMYSKYICESIERLSRIENKAVLRSLALSEDTESSSEESTDDSDAEVTDHHELLNTVDHPIDPPTLIETVKRPSLTTLKLLNTIQLLFHLLLKSSLLN